MPTQQPSGEPPPYAKPETGAPFVAPNCSASEPLRRNFSEEELRDAALAWMRKNRAEGYEPNTDRYHEKLGLLVDFVTDLMQNGQDSRQEGA